MTVRIVTDSTAYLSEEILEKYDIQVASLEYLFQMSSSWKQKLTMIIFMKE